MLVDEGVLRSRTASARSTATSTRWRCRRACTRCSARASTGSTREARDALERGAIEGEVFHRGAVVELSAPDVARRPCPASSTTLAGQGPRPLRRGRASSARPPSASSTSSSATPPTARPRRSSAPRCTSSSPTGSSGMAGERVTEYEEILGYHLEQSYRYRTELGPADDEDPRARRPRGRPARSRRPSRHRPRRRRRRGQPPRPRGRAAPGREPRSESRSLLDLVVALAASVSASRRPRRSLDRRSRPPSCSATSACIARVSVEKAWLVVYARAERSAEASALREAEEAIPVFERLGDDTVSRARCEVVAIVHCYYGRLSEAAAASERGYLPCRARARRAGSRASIASAGRLPTSGASPRSIDVEELLEDDLAWARGTGSLGVEAKATLRLGVVRSARGDRVEGDELFARGMSHCSDLGMRLWAAGIVGCWIWGLTDDPLFAELQLREQLRRARRGGPARRPLDRRDDLRRVHCTGRGATTRPTTCSTSPPRPARKTTS